ncbi:MAG: hypothetical protein H7831_08545 [Magnetococcus sp. WYHC-3]
MVISHPQTDHMAGATRVLGNFRVDELWLPPTHKAPRADESALLAAAQHQGTTIRRMTAGEGVEVPGGRLEVWHPARDFPWRNPNDGSLVVALDYHGRHWLFTGDIQKKAERALLAAGSLPRVDWLMVPHHGSRSSSTPGLVTALQPGHAVVSAGRHNPWGLPRAEVLERWRGAGASIHRTDQEGSLYFVSDGGPVRRITPPE